MNPYAALAISVALISTGVGLGAVGHDAMVMQPCAKGFPDKCPVPIKNAVAALKLKSAEKQIEYRDRLVPVVVHDATEDRERMAETMADIAAITSQERTNACASSPAFVSRRERLCASVGGPDCGDSTEAPR